MTETTPIWDPNGVTANSPGLPRSGYPGKRRKKTFNPKGGCGMIRQFAWVQTTTTIVFPKGIGRNPIGVGHEIDVETQGSRGRGNPGLCDATPLGSKKRIQRVWR